MLRKWTWVLCLTTVALVEAVPLEVLSDSSLLRLLKKRHSSGHRPRTQWSYHPQEDSYRQASQGVSHGYASYPYQSALKLMESPSEHPTYYSLSSQEYWKPNSANSNSNSNSTGSSYYGYSRTQFGPTSVAGGSSYQDSRQGTHSTYQFQQALSGGGKKVPAFYLRGSGQVQGFDVSGKSQYKKTGPHLSLSAHKKAVYPRVHKPYVKHKYPTRKTVHPLYRRYYQSPYQRYAIPSREMLRFKVNVQAEDNHKASTASPLASPEGYHTTERMDDAYPEGSSASEDYSAYHKNTGTYYETYEEVEKTTSEPEESSYDEATTRGYYGDRIYMSTQVPFAAADKTPLKNKYFLVRRTSADEDIETIFE